MNKYSREFVLKLRKTEECKIMPDEIVKIQPKITLTIIKTTLSWRPPRKENQWANIKVDVKRITSILNKLTDSNYDKFVEETKTFNYADSLVVKFLFKKILSEPFFSEIYANFCFDLELLHPILRETCLEEFTNNRNKNIGQFIAELYKLGLITNISDYISILLADLTEQNLEVLWKIIMTAGPKDPIFESVILFLKSIMPSYSKRYQFIIMDLTDATKK